MILSLLQWGKAYFYAHITIYYKHFLYSKRIDIRDSNETLDYIISNRVSVSRFGDGEIDVIAGRGNGMQTPNSSLGERLKEVLQAHINNHIVCLPFGWKSTKGLQQRNKLNWTWYVADNYDLLIENTYHDRTYYNASFTRFYMDVADKNSEAMKKYVERLRIIWEKRDVCLVEGERTRFGVGNDFLENAKTIKRIICPSKDAFDKYQDIYNAVCSNVPKDILILCALGMTATVLAYDLTKAGYQAIDIGHADIEYEWYKKGVDKKVPIEGKNVNELGILNPEAPYDSEYESEIIAKVL